MMSIEPELRTGGISAQRSCVYVVGAGFSAGLRYPLVSDLLHRFWSTELDSEFRERLRKVIAFHHPGFNPELFSTFPNIEQLLSEIETNIEFFEFSRPFEGRFTKEELIGIKRELLRSIASWFYDISRGNSGDSDRQGWLQAFRDLVRKENAAIISFNWDLELDELLFGDSLGRDTYGLVGQNNGVILLKPHGSLNWYTSDLGKHIKKEKTEIIYGESGQDAVYLFRPNRLPVSEVGRAYTPLIIPPAYIKDFRASIFQKLWQQCTFEIGRAKKIVFLGYSMPASDMHVQLILRCGFNNQRKGEPLQDRNRDEAVGKAEVLIVNPDQSAAVRTYDVSGRDGKCKWLSNQVAEWISGHTD